MIRIVHFPGIMTSGGVESVIMNWYRNINRNDVQFIFCVCRSEYHPVDDEIEKLGGMVLHIPQMRQVGLRRYVKEVTALLKDNSPIDAVHIHSTHMGVMNLLASKKAGINNRLYHIHSTQSAALKQIPFRAVLEKIIDFLIKKNCTCRLACGKEAGRFIYGNSDFKVINNAVNIERFKPLSQATIRDIRSSLGINEADIVVGNMARFVEGKNQSFLVRIAALDKKRGGKIKILLVGDGPKLVEVKKLAAELGCEDKVIFTGNRSDSELMYNAMDIFSLPSYFEGLPVTMIEAQASGLPCVVSTNVTDEALLNITECRKLSLSEKEEKWLDILITLQGKRILDDAYIAAKFIDAKYDIKTVASIMESLYKGLKS